MAKTTTKCEGCGKKLTKHQARLFEGMWVCEACRETLNEDVPPEELKSLVDEEELKALRDAEKKGELSGGPIIPKVTEPYPSVERVSLGVNFAEVEAQLMAHLSTHQQEILKEALRIGRRQTKIVSRLFELVALYDREFKK